MIGGGVWWETRRALGRGAKDGCDFVVAITTFGHGHCSATATLSPSIKVACA